MSPLVIREFAKANVPKSTTPLSEDKISNKMLYDYPVKVGFLIEFIEKENDSFAAFVLSKKVVIVIVLAELLATHV